MGTPVGKPLLCNKSNNSCVSNHWVATPGKQTPPTFKTAKQAPDGLAVLT